jgi:cyclohexa-1,5-dienecarbonyl-CoA hydratase
MSDGAQLIKFTVQGAVARVTLQRPPLHVLNLEMLAELDAALLEIEEQDEVAIVVIESRGGRAFSAGVDVADHVLARVDRMLTRFHTVLRRLISWDRLSVAVVHGPALGGGCELAACCDLLYAAEGASFGQPEITLGCFPPAAAALFPLMLPHAKAAELVLTGRRWTAPEAERAGLVTRTFANTELRGEVDALVANLAEQSPAVLRVMRRAFGAGGREAALDALSRCEQIYRDQLMKLDDMQEGVTAFLEKRDPIWKNR